MGNSIKPHIEHAQKTGVCNLSKQNLAELPEGLQTLSKNLRTLDVSENKLTVLPTYVGSFAQLKSLNINNNRLTSLPPQIGSLQRLETLMVEHNRITSLPPTVEGLKSLRHISLAHNDLRAFPVQLCAIRTLDVIDLSHNKLTDVPDAIRDLNAIELNVNQNQISRLSESLAACPRLKVLRIEENCLPLAAFTPRILRESPVSLLAIDGNVFDMKSFQELDGYDQYMERYTSTKKKFQ